MRIKIVKYLGEILTNYVQDLPTENYKILLREIKEVRKCRHFPQT